MSPALAGRFFTTSATWEAHKLYGFGQTSFIQFLHLEVAIIIVHTQWVFFFFWSKWDYLYKVLTMVSVPKLPPIIICVLKTTSLILPSCLTLPFSTLHLQLISFTKTFKLLTTTQRFLIYSFQSKWSSPRIKSWETWHVSVPNYLRLTFYIL